MSTTAKAYAGAVVAALTAILPDVDGIWSTMIKGALAAAAAYGIVWTVPNATGLRGARNDAA